MKYLPLKVKKTASGREFSFLSRKETSFLKPVWWPKLGAKIRDILFWSTFSLYLTPLRSIHANNLSLSLSLSLSHRQSFSVSLSESLFCSISQFKNSELISKNACESPSSRRTDQDGQHPRALESRKP